MPTHPGAPILPPVTEPDPLAPPDLISAVDRDGSLNDDVVYRCLTPFHIPFTAEQAIEVLVQQPYGSTTHSRCQAMQQAIQVVTSDPTMAGHLVVSDAAMKMVALNQHLNQSRAELQAFRRRAAEEMEQLHERLNRLRILMDETNANYNALEEAGRERVDNLTGVIAFFDEFQAYLRLEAEAALSYRPDNLPAFLRDETALKLLGMELQKEAA